MRRWTQTIRESNGPTSTGLVGCLAVVFFVVLVLFLITAANLARTSASPLPTVDLAATLAALPTDKPTSETDNLVLLLTQTIPPAPTDIPTLVPTEIPTQVPTAVPTDVFIASPTPETLIPVTGVDLNEEQAAASRQSIRIGLGTLALGLIVLGILLRQKNKS